MMAQWHPWHWRLWPMVVAAMLVIVVNSAVAVDAATTIPSLALMVAAKTPSPLLPLTAAHQQRLLLPLSMTPITAAVQSMAVAVFVDGNSNGEGRRGQGRTGAQG
jgi:hypothetical protein